MLTFQQIIQTLTTFWEKHGCIIHQGHSAEVGAGTFNPATFLRCLGPEPYNTVYVEPSMRPTDGRYGENPNRVQLFHQFQVIMKPSPANIQELYLGSLEALGLNLKEHDIRFVHDDWESPTLGAWGLGWEVWCDGMEITQFTYFQAIASQNLHPVSVELAYGLERLAMFIQNVQNIFDVKWNEHLTFKDISKQLEVEWSTYNFESADVSMWRRHFDDFEKEASAQVSKGLAMPAYDFVLKASHAFNILDARGVISVTERTGYIGRIRDLARQVAARYLESREEQGFPLLDKKENPVAQTIFPPLSPSFNPDNVRDFLLEIGSEQLPATFVPIGMQNIEKCFANFFKEKGLSFKSIKTYGTPQRLTIYVQDLAEGTKEKVTTKKGPPVAAAFDSTGKPTPLGSGFLRSIQIDNGLHLEELASFPSIEIKTIKETAYLFYHQKEEGLSTLSLLAESLTHLMLQIDFPKKMRWSNKTLSYARPVHWILALFGEEVVPFSFDGILSGSKTKGHAQLSPHFFEVTLPSLYLNTLEKHFVLADPKRRKESIEAALEKIQKEKKVHVVAKEKVLAKVLYLTEWPKIMVGSFDSNFLKIPPEILICEMVEHQSYFPLQSESQQLTNHFLITADNQPTDLILQGNEKVLSARLSDGSFLYKQDLKKSLEYFAEKLHTMTFQKELGSMGEKISRIKSHALYINSLLNLTEVTLLERGALLCKADLCATLTQEFPELQGTIGKYYAKEQKEPEAICAAIEEHWMPITDGAPLPRSSLGTLLSLSDKVDNLLAYFSVGLKPSSSSDPYALKRQTFGLLRMFIENKLTINLHELFINCARHFPSTLTPPIDEILSFITGRAKSVLESFSLKKDEIEAGLQGLCLDPYSQFCKIKALSSFRRTEAFSSFLEVYKRLKGFTSSKEEFCLDRSLLIEPAEVSLLTSLDKMEKDLSLQIEKKDYSSAFLLLSELKIPLSIFLEEVKIQVDDVAIRKSRVALIRRVFSLFDALLDFSKIQEG